MKIVWQSIISIGFILLLLCIQIIYWINPITFSDIVLIRDELFRLINYYPLLSAGIYISLYALSIIFGIPISATIIGGYFFGITRGIIYSMIGVACGTFILCSLVRYVIREWIMHYYKDQLEPFNKELKKYGIHYIIIVHMIPFMPGFLPHIATGISTIPLYTIIGMNILAAFPLTCLYAGAGAYIPRLDSIQEFIYYITIFGIALGLLFLTGMLYRRYIQ